MSEFVSYQDVIKKNRMKTKIVLGIYFIIYTFIGLLLDVIIYNQGDFISSIEKLITFQVFPIATVTMFGIGILGVLIAITMFKRIQLAGSKYKEITPNSNDPDERRLYNIMEELKISANMPYMPKIYLLDEDYMNAFASGWNEKNTMVAITRGLYNKLNREEVAAVMAHELTHIRNEDIKLTLIVGVAANIMLLAVDWIVFMFLKGDSDGAKKAKSILLILHFILPIITVLLQMWLSRSREYMADSGAVELIRNPEAMASALRKISGDYKEHKYRDDNKTRKAAYIFEPDDSLFSTHPSIKSRIEKLIGKNGFKKVL